MVPYCLPESHSKFVDLCWSWGDVERQVRSDISLPPRVWWHASHTLRKGQPRSAPCWIFYRNDSFQRAHLLPSVYPVEESTIWNQGVHDSQGNVRQVYVKFISTLGPVSEEREVNLSGWVIRELMVHYRDVGHHLYTDNYYMTVPMTKEFLKQKVTVSFISINQYHSFELQIYHK